MLKEPFMPPKPEEEKEEATKEAPQGEICFTYPDGTIGVAKSRKEAADLMEEYRNNK